MPDNQGHIKPTAELIRQYLEGSLDDKTMHALEKQALDDPFLADALEGFAMHPADQQPALNDLQARLEKRVAGKTKVRGINYKWLAAAAVLLLVTTTAVFILNRPLPPTADIAQVKDLRQKDSAAAAAAGPADSKPATAPAGNAVMDSNVSAEAAAVQPALETAKAASQPAVKAKNQPRPAAPAVEIQAEKPVPAAAAPMAAMRMKDVAATANYEEKIDTIRIGRYAADSTTYTYAAKPPAVEGKIYGAPSKYPNLSNEHGERLISGVVIDAATGARLPGVSVLQSGTRFGATTDSAGNFALRVPTSNHVKLDVLSIGYQKTNVEVAANSTGQLNIKLPASNQALSETVVVGYGSQRKESIRLRGINTASSGAPAAPRPSVPMEAYNTYLNSRQKLVIPGLLENQTGQVRLSFTVKPDGTLKDFTVLESMGDAANRAAIRIVREGPKWLPAADGKKAKAEVTVPVQLLKQE